MQLRCPKCCSEEAALVDRGTRLECGNCAAVFVREEALVAVADAEAELPPAAPSAELFRLDRERAAEELRGPEGAISVVNPYSDADELNALADDALTAQIVTREDADAHFAIYPMSLSEPDPIVSVNPGTGPALLGHSIKLRQHEGEDPVSFTLRLLGDMVAEANRLAGSGCAFDTKAQETPTISEQAASETEAETTSRRYALVVVLDAASPEQAWEAVHGLVGGLEGGGEPDCIYVGAPWQGIPADAADLSTERLDLGMSVPDGEGGFVAASTALRPCFD